MIRILSGAEVCDSTDAGGKAAMLARMERAGLFVPPWFVVVTATARMTLRMPESSALTTATARTNAGRISNTSIGRTEAVSHQPPRWPACKPTGTPIPAASPIVKE